MLLGTIHAAQGQDAPELDYVTSDVICSAFSLGAAGEQVHDDDRQVLLTTDDMFYDASESYAEIQSKSTILLIK